MTLVSPRSRRRRSLHLARRGPLGGIDGNEILTSAAALVLIALLAAEG
jgi:hypothetical protein